MRGHWSIENRLHWQLDVTFQEDQCRIRQGHADANFSILRRTALSLLKNNHTLKVGIKNKRLTAGWDDDYLDTKSCSEHDLWCNRPDSYPKRTRTGNPWVSSSPATAQVIWQQSVACQLRHQGIVAALFRKRTQYLDCVFNS